VTIQPERSEFAGNGPLAFQVVLKNESDSSVMLYASDQLGLKAKLVISNLENAKQWTVSLSKLRRIAGSSQVLAAGKSLKYTIVVQSSPRIVPIPRPIPRPIPFPKRGAAQLIRVPKRPPVFVGPLLPCGQGKCRAWLLMEFGSNPARIRYQFPHWIGKTATGTVDFKIGAPRPVPFPTPPIPPPVVGPLTKQQAIQRAVVVAESSLSSIYRPFPPHKPAHQGRWIAQPQKNARAAAVAGGGWSVQWTFFPKGKGFEYNVRIDISTRGVATLREAFADYSN
jgi:hypothetical protein